MYGMLPRLPGFRRNCISCDPCSQAVFIQISARERKHRLNSIDLVSLQAVSVDGEEQTDR